METSGDYALGNNQMTPEGWGNINFNWKDYGAKAMFFGCRTASSIGNDGEEVTPWAQTISRNTNMNNVSVYGQTMRSFPSIYPDEMKQTSDIRNDTHHRPTYMVGASRSLMSRIRRSTGIGGNSSYPMAGYINGQPGITRYQSYR